MYNQNGLTNWLAIGVILVGIIAVIVMTLQSPTAEVEPLPTRAAAAPSPTATPTPSPTPTDTPIPTVALPTPTPTPIPLDLPLLDLPADGQVFRLTPLQANDVGWLREFDTRDNHLGDFNIYAGIYDDNIHLGAIRFDLSSIAPGTPILHADITLVGLEAEFLASEANASHNAASLNDTGQEDARQEDAPQNEVPQIEAPQNEARQEDAGAGNRTLWNVELLEPWMTAEWDQLDFETLDRTYNVAAPLLYPRAAAELGHMEQTTFFFSPAALALLEARLYQGDVAFRVVGPTTAQDNLFSWDSGFGAGSLGNRPLLRLVTGPSPEAPPPSPTPQYVIITPDPRDIVARAAAAQTATAQAAAQVTPYTGEETPTPTPTATPYPPNWVTPVIVTNTPEPENVATAAWQQQVATAQAVVMGTPTPFPVNMWTATPSPGPTATRDVILYAELTATPTPTPTPQEIPPVLRGKILFLSNRFGDSDGDLMVMDGDGSNVSIWAAGGDSWVYRQARLHEDVAPDGSSRVIVSDRRLDTEAQNLLANPQLFVVSLDSDTWPQRITDSGMNYDAVWSPVDYRIAYVSSSPGNDEIFTVRPDGSDRQRLTFNEWEWDKHPSWSPDGTQIVFWSNRGVGHRQIWIMDADGSNQRNLSNNEYDDWDPVWVK